MALDQETLKAIQNEARRVAEEVYATKGTRFGVANVPIHTHNNTDTSQLPFINETPSNGNGVLSTQWLTGFVKGASSVAQTIVNMTTKYAFFPVQIPIPIIQGFGTTSTLTLTGSPVAGATSATLTVAFAGTTGRYASRFGAAGAGEMRKVQYTNGSTAVTWTTALVENTGSTSLIITGNSRFLGGDAPFGTMVGFLNSDDGIIQLWIKMSYDTDPINSWSGFDFDQLAP